MLCRYQLLGLRFDRIEPGFVDAFTGDPALRRQVVSEPAPDPADLAAEARVLLNELGGAHGAGAGALTAARSEFLAAHLRALECSARRFAGEQIGFVDEVRAYFDVEIIMGSTETYHRAHRALGEALPGRGPLAERLEAHRRATVIPAEKLPAAVEAFSSALRDRVRARFPLPAAETVVYEIVTDKPWSGFNYYEGGYRSRVAINADLPTSAGDLPHLIAHESYPGHHTEHCRKEAGIVAAGQIEHTLFLVNTPQCLMAEGLADHALETIVGPGWGMWAQEIYADLGIRFDGAVAEEVAAARAGLAGVRQDAALLLHDRGADADTAAAHLQRWALMSPERARQSLRFLTSPLWRAYISTYVEGYRLLGAWMDASVPGGDRVGRFGRLLDEPLIPSALRAEIAAARPDAAGPAGTPETR